MQDHCTTDSEGLKELQAVLLDELIDLAMAELGYAPLNDEDYAVLVEECRKQVVISTRCGNQEGAR